MERRIMARKEDVEKYIMTMVRELLPIQIGISLAGNSLLFGKILNQNIRSILIDCFNSIRKNSTNVE